MRISCIRLSEEEIGKKGIRSWPVWKKGISRFPWTYDSIEECFILEGEFIVQTDSETVHVKPGDFVTFPSGLACTWEILKPVRKHYNFP